jgi:hypothetical protein
VSKAKFSSIFEFPIVKKSEYIAEEAVSFENINRSRADQWLHFYIDDYKFECLWNDPKRYLSMLKRFDGVITPDYSLCYDMPLAMQIWNTYRNRTLAHWIQSSGVNIIPNVSWGDARSYDFAFDGIEKGGTIAIGTVGTMRNMLNRAIFANGLPVMVERLQPEIIICVGSAPESIFGFLADRGIKLIQIDGDTKAFFKGKAGSANG